MGKVVDHAGQIVEGVIERSPRRRLGLTKARQIRGDQTEATFEARDQILRGADPDSVASRGALKNPDSLDAVTEVAHHR